MNITTGLAIAILVLLGLLGLSAWEIKHEIGKNAQLTSDLSAANESLKQMAKAQSTVTQIDKSFEAKRDEIKSDQVKLDTAVAARTVILRVPAKCVPSPSATPSQSDERVAELDPALRPSYSSLRAGIAEKEAQINGLHEYINKVCLKL